MPVRFTVIAPTEAVHAALRRRPLSAGAVSTAEMPASPGRDVPPLFPKVSDTSMYSIIGAARGLTSLELRGFDFPLAAGGHCHLSALGGMRLRHLVLHATRFQDDARRSLAEALMSALADLPELVSLDMAFPRCAGRLARVRSTHIRAAQSRSALRSGAKPRSPSRVQRHSSGLPFAPVCASAVMMHGSLHAGRRRVARHGCVGLQGQLVMAHGPRLARARRAQVAHVAAPVAHEAGRRTVGPVRPAGTSPCPRQCLKSMSSASPVEC